jgi:hypothetical protein
MSRYAESGRHERDFHDGFAARNPRDREKRAACAGSFLSCRPAAAEFEKVASKVQSVNEQVLPFRGIDPELEWLEFAGLAETSHRVTRATQIPTLL